MFFKVILKNFKFGHISCANCPTQVGRQQNNECQRKWQNKVRKSGTNCGVLMSSSLTAYRSIDRYKYIKWSLQANVKKSKTKRIQSSKRMRMEKEREKLFLNRACFVLTYYSWLNVCFWTCLFVALSFSYSKLYKKRRDSWFVFFEKNKNKNS